MTSLLSFNLGAFVGRLGDRMGPHKRLWLVLSTFLQVLLTMAAALSVWKSGQGSIAAVRGDPSWTSALTFVALAFMSASLGVQGIVGKRLNTQFTTTSTSNHFPPPHSR
jgi:MFS family permease